MERFSFGLAELPVRGAGLMGSLTRFRPWLPAFWILAVAACERPMEVPEQPVAPPGDPALFELDEALYSCGWSPGPPEADDEWGLFDVGTGRDARPPAAVDVETIELLGGRVVYEYHVERLRAILLTGWVPKLGATFVRSVPDASKFPVTLTVRWEKPGAPLDMSHFDSIRTWGGEIDNDYFGCLYGASRIQATVPDSAIPKIRGPPGVSTIWIHGESNCRAW